jgi:hypothetical protein
VEPTFGTAARVTPRAAASARTEAVSQEAENVEVDTRLNQLVNRRADAWSRSAMA